MTRNKLNPDELGRVKRIYSQSKLVLTGLLLVYGSMLLYLFDRNMEGLMIFLILAWMAMYILHPIVHRVVSTVRFILLHTLIGIGLLVSGIKYGFVAPHIVFIILSSDLKIMIAKTDSNDEETQITE